MGDAREFEAMHSTVSQYQGTQYQGETQISHTPGEARIVQFKSGRPGPCVFIIPGTGGRIEGFAPLVTALDTPMPVFAIEARGVDGSTAPDTDIGEMADHYIARVQTLQPQGPYFLGGHSFGGLVALEMAQRLLRAQQPVACLFMMDTPISERYWPLRFYIRKLPTRLSRHARRILTDTPAANMKYYFRRFLARRAGLENLPPEVMIGSNIARVMLASELARKAYRPEFYPGKLTFFVSPQADDYDALWRGRAAGLEVHATAGGHLTMIYPPHVVSLARDLSRCLAQGLADAGIAAA
jgi:thioesterase domain-containing protein